MLAKYEQLGGPILVLFLPGPPSLAGHYESHGNVKIKIAMFIFQEAQADSHALSVVKLDISPENVQTTQNKVASQEEAEIVLNVVKLDIIPGNVLTTQNIATLATCSLIQDSSLTADLVSTNNKALVVTTTTSLITQAQDSTTVSLVAQDLVIINQATQVVINQMGQ